MCVWREVEEAAERMALPRGTWRTQEEGKQVWLGGAIVQFRAYIRIVCEAPSWLR